MIDELAPDEHVVSAPHHDIIDVDAGDSVNTKTIKIDTSSS